MGNSKRDMVLGGVQDKKSLMPVMSLTSLEGTFFLVDRMTSRRRSISRLSSTALQACSWACWLYTAEKVPFWALISRGDLPELSGVTSSLTSSSSSEIGSERRDEAPACWES